jgi:uracil-DNA glycosylase
MPTPFCPGYSAEPYATLVREYPPGTPYKKNAFRIEWGPVFHRGRLDGTARVLAIGQDPAQHEVIARRILVGTAGKRVQGFMHKLGMNRSYVLINAFLYSVYGQQGGESSIGNAAIRDYRNRWIAAILDTNPIEVVVAFGGLADKAWAQWLASPAARGRAALPYQKVLHPTSPISGGAGNPAAIAARTKQMLLQWNAAIDALKPSINIRDMPFAPKYGNGFKNADLPDVPMDDLPAGSPEWMATENQWADRVGTGTKKRRTIQVVVPNSVAL